MKKLLIVIVVVAIAGFAAWQNKVAILLAAIKYQSLNAHNIAPTPVLPWGQGPSQPQGSGSSRPPNIVLIVADDLGYNDISTFGGGLDNGRIKTPSIDQLASQGVVFNQSYSGASTCAPSRGMIMTGRYPTRTGFEFTPTPGGMGKMVTLISDSLDANLPPAIYDEALEKTQPAYEMKGLPGSEVTLAEVLKENGYYTAHIGKWHLGRSNGMAPNDQGFDDSLLMASGLFLPEDDANVVNAKLDFDPIDRFLWARMTFANSFNTGDTDRFRPGGYLTDYWTDESINVIRANKHRPFFLYLAHWTVHTPLQATKADYDAVGDIKPHRKRVYAAMIRSLDRSVKRVMDALEQEGLADNTIVVFTSDNGGPGYIGIDSINQPYRGWKITQFEGGIRVPLFIKMPQKIEAGTVVDTPVAHIDLMPTLLSAVGLEPPKEVTLDGKNLLPLTKPNGEQQWDRENLFWQNGHYQVVRHKDWKLQVNDRPVGGMKKWLFDLAQDPTEQTNLAEARPEIVAKLEGLLAERNAERRPPLYQFTLQAPVAIDKTLAEPFVAGDEYVYTPN